VPETVEAVVTGAASGIGRACAERIHAEGVHVLAVDRNAGGLKDFRERGVATLVADLSSEAETGWWLRPPERGTWLTGRV
jgi:NAD(P)-dependent dehydrogenase (short-subunit alcohol dehydrogenase family)